MTKKRIENPKVFISYAWGDEEYQNQVLAFATQLLGDGIDVVLDKWNLTEGNDTYAFMEKCATDPSITNVLMLLDPIYAKKADDHTGGVGTETQIISAKVYQEVTQDKFIPVIMQRDEEGNVCKPTYLQGRLHFDLSLPERFDEEYRRLVKKLYGVEVYKKPEVGKKPEWVDNPKTVSPKRMLSYDAIKRIQTPDLRKEALVNYLEEIKKELLDFANNHSSQFAEPEEYIAQYNETDITKSCFLQLMKDCISVPNCVQLVAGFFEETINSLPQIGIGAEIVRIRIHELFIYVIAILLKLKNYNSVGYLLGKRYYNHLQRRNNFGIDSYFMFYSGADHQRLDNAIRKRDDKAYYTGTGQYWIETMAIDFCTKEQFVLADLICFNYSVYGINYIGDWQWFPITYNYDNRNNSCIEQFSKKLASHEFAQEIAPIFGYNSVEDLTTKMTAIEEDPQKEYRNIRHSGSFDSAPLIKYYIRAKDVGSFH